MGLPRYVTLGTTTVTAPFNLSYFNNPFQVTVAVTGSSSGTFEYALQYTLDDQQYLTNIGSTRSLVWINSTAASSAVANSIVSIDTPIAAIRLSATALSSAQLTMCVVQSGG